MKNCIICGSKRVEVNGSFIPKTKYVHSFGGIPGKTRIIYYNLCGKCSLFRAKTKKKLVEDKLKAMVNSAIKKALEQGTMIACTYCGGLSDMLHVGNRRIVFGTCIQCRPQQTNTGK